MITCHFGGYLVSAKNVLPVDPVDRQVYGLPLVGCNHLRCARCDVLVRNVVDVDLATRSADFGALYDTPELRLSPQLKPFPLARLYLCRCQCWLELRFHPLDDPDAEPYEQPNLPWRCDGHPTAQLPHEFDGVRIEDAAGAQALTVRSLHGWVPEAAHPEDHRRAFWISRLHVRLQNTPAADAVVQAALPCLEHPDPRVRARALQLFFSLEIPAGRVRALELLEGDRRLFVGVRDEITTVEVDTTLEETLWRVVTPLVQQPGRARSLAEAEALRPGKGRHALYAALASGDAEWTAAHAEQIARATPERTKDLIDQCRARFPRHVPATPVIERLSALQ